MKTTIVDDKARPIRGFTCRGLIEAGSRGGSISSHSSGSAALLAAASLKRNSNNQFLIAAIQIRGFTCRGLIEADKTNRRGEGDSLIRGFTCRGLIEATRLNDVERR